MTCIHSDTSGNYRVYLALKTTEMFKVRHSLLLPLLLILGCDVIPLVNSLRFLLVTFPIQSHASCMTSIGLGLSARKHDVHFFYAEGNPLPSSLRATQDIKVELYKRPSLDPESPAFDFNQIFDQMTRMILEGKASIREVFDFVGTYTSRECRTILMQNDVLLDRLRDMRFDLVVLDGVFFAKCLNLIPHRLQVPWVSLTDTLEPALVRTPWLPSFVSNPIMPFTDRMNFFQRIQNTLMSAVAATASLVPEPDDDILIRYRTYGQFESIDELAMRTSLWILSTDHTLDYARPTMPNLIQAPGLTVKPSTHDLPEDIKAFIDGSKHGVILVSFGSMSSQFPSAITEKFLSAFVQVTGYRIIWRFNNKGDAKLPEDILTLNWIPQNDILAHPKTKLFITHCGNNGQYESLYHAVPMIGFPLHGDQPYNARRMTHKGFGLAMNIHQFTAEELVANIEKILSDKSFKEKISKASEIYRSAPQTSGEKAAWWIEHVTIFGGDHLRSAGNDLPLYQYLMIDVWAFLFAVSVLFLFGVWKAMRFIIRKVFTRTKRPDKRKRQ